MKLTRRTPDARSADALSAADGTATDKGPAVADLLGVAVDRRTFLRSSGLAAGGAAVLAAGGPAMLKKARAAESHPKAGVETETVHSVCTHCSVGCGVVAEVQNGVWTGQEPDYRSPINLGAHCAKGAALREHGHGERRLKYPMKLVGGQWELAVWALANFSDRHHADMTIFGGELYTTCTMCKRLVPYSSEPGEDSGIVYCRGAHCLAEDVPLHVGRSIAMTTMTECFNGFRRLAGGVCGYPPLRGAPVSLQLPVLHCTGNYAKRVVLFILACQPAGLQDKARRVLLAISGKGSMGSLYLREFRELVAAAVVHPAVFSNSLDPAFSILLQLTQLMNAAWRGALTGPGAAVREGSAAAAQLAASLLGPL